MDANGELRVSNYLIGSGLCVERFDKTAMQQSRTPDFIVMAGDRLAFYCEVKTAQEDDRLERELDAAPENTMVTVGGSDPTWNRFSNYIHTAVGQFDAVNPDCEYPNVLAIVNHDDEAGANDLKVVLTGKDDMGKGPILMFDNFESGGRIREEKHRIHLYLWFDAGKPEPFKVWTQSHPDHHAALCGYLGIDPASIKRS